MLATFGRCYMTLRGTVPVNSEEIGTQEKIASNHLKDLSDDLFEKIQWPIIK